MFFKKRTKFGQFIDRNLGYGGQERIREETGLSRDTITRACNEDGYVPRGSVLKSLLKVARELTGKDVRKEDFWM